MWRIMTDDNNQLEITKRFRFEAHHKLPWHRGKCARDHGHSYVLEVSVTGPVKEDIPGVSDSGMVCDFYEISSVVKPIIEDYLDHHSLNDLMQNPTAENIVGWLVPVLNAALPGILSRVRLYETTDGWVEWRQTIESHEETVDD